MTARPTDYTRVQRLVAEGVGTSFLLAAIVGSGVMASRLSDDAGLVLLQNALATAGVLAAVIMALQGVSGAHFNPAVTIAEWATGGMNGRVAGSYVVALVAGGFVGVVAANVMFDLPVVEIAETSRSGANLWFAEGVATFGLLLVIFGIVRTGKAIMVGPAVGAYIAAVYYFASSTGFANPAVTIGRVFTDSFAGIEPASVPMFLVAQLVGTAVAVGFIRTVLVADDDG